MIDTVAGYVYARERWWQLEVGRKIVQGNLSSVLGKGALEDDIFFRSLNLISISQANFDIFEAKVQKIIQQAVDGINSYYSTISPESAYPAEYLLYRLKEEPPANWTVAEAVASGVKILSFGLANGQGVQSSTGDLLAQGVSAETILASLQPRPFEPSVIGGLNSSSAEKPVRASMEKAKIVHADLDRRFRRAFQKIGMRGKKLHFPRASNNWVSRQHFAFTFLELIHCSRLFRESTRIRARPFSAMTHICSTRRRPCG